jgi:DNA-binding MurR/RpiR family transcriptional regulator
VLPLLKIFTTQLVGYFNKIQEEEEMNIEDCSRAIAQAIVGDGNVYVHGINEMQVVSYEAVLGQERLPKTNFLFEDGKIASLTNIDRVIIAAPYSNDQEAIALAKKVKEAGSTVIGISVVNNKNGEESLEMIADFHLNPRLDHPLVPTDEGDRIGLPSTMAALYCYFALYLTTKEIVADY